MKKTDSQNRSNTETEPRSAQILSFDTFFHESVEETDETERYRPEQEGPVSEDLAGPSSAEAAGSAEKRRERRLTRRKVRARRRRASGKWILLAILAAAVVAVILLLIPMLQKALTTDRPYTWQAVKEIELSSTEKQFTWSTGECLLAGDENGVRAYSGDGELLWNHSLQMNSPALFFHGPVAAVVDLGGQQACVLDKKGVRATITLHDQLQILSACVTGAGKVILISENEEGQRISLYSEDGERLLERRTVFEEDGYPMAAGQSFDEQVMITAYAQYKEREIGSRVAFFDMDPSKGNDPDRILSSQIEKAAIPFAIQTTEDSAIVFFDSVIVGYALDERCEERWRLPLTNAIVQLAQTPDGFAIYYGAELSHSDSALEGQLVMYDADGTVRWQKDAEELRFLQSLEDGVIYGTDGLYTALDSQGQPVWTYQGTENAAAFYVMGEDLFVIDGHTATCLSRVEADPEAGEEHE